MYRCGVDFVAMPRTGSRAVAKMLMEQFGAVRIGTHHAGPPQHPLKRPAFTVIRHPMDSFVSWFYWRGGAGTLDVDWIRGQVERHENTYYWRLPDGTWSMWRWVTGPDAIHAPGLTVLRWEDLQAGVDRFLLEHLGETHPIPLEGVSEKREGRPWQEYFNDEMFLWVTENFPREAKEYY